MVELDAAVLSTYRRFSLYNSPFPAHDRGCAVDLYPDSQLAAPSPVAGEVVETRTVRAPDRPYAHDEEYLVLVDTGDHVARILHVEPSVAAGDRVAVGDSLGTMVRSGFFAPWVDNHIHLGFREHGANHHRASGSLPVEPGVTVDPLDWDGTGRVAEAGLTYVVLDSPAHPAPGERFVGLANGRGGVLDGGCPHYDGGGALPGTDGPVSLAGRRVGVADGRDVTWDDLTVLVDGRPATGVSLFCARDADFGVKLVFRDGHDLSAGDHVTVTVA
ncbi:MAG: hypothetical protein ABEJ06_06210 [Haloarculaceae archaeon]